MDRTRQLIQTLLQKIKQPPKCHKSVQNLRKLFIDAGYTDDFFEQWIQTWWKTCIYSTAIKVSRLPRNKKTKDVNIAEDIMKDISYLTQEKLPSGIDVKKFFEKINTVIDVLTSEKKLVGKQEGGYLHPSIILIILCGIGGVVLFIGVLISVIIKGCRSNQVSPETPQQPEEVKLPDDRRSFVDLVIINKTLTDIFVTPIPQPLTNAPIVQSDTPTPSEEDYEKLRELYQILVATILNLEISPKHIDKLHEISELFERKPILLEHLEQNLKTFFEPLPSSDRDVFANDQMQSHGLRTLFNNSQEIIDFAKSMEKHGHGQDSVQYVEKYRAFAIKQYKELPDGIMSRVRWLLKFVKTLKLQTFCNEQCICFNSYCEAPSQQQSQSGSAIKLRVLKCGHIYHEDCITLWYKSEYPVHKIRTCPSCRNSEPHVYASYMYDPRKSQQDDQTRAAQAQGGKRTYKRLDACTVEELKQRAKKRGINVKGLKKAEILAKLRKNN